MVIDKQNFKNSPKVTGKIYSLISLFFCFDIIKFLKPVFHAWSPAHFMDNNQNREKCVFLIVAVVFFRLKFLV